MYLSAERLALANQAVRETFEQSSVAWQAIPHWDTGDPSQTQVASDSLPASSALPIFPVPVPIEVTMADVLAPSPDALLTKVIAATVWLAAVVDYGVIGIIRSKTTATQAYNAANTNAILTMLIKARATVEDYGYRAPSCIFVGTTELTELSTTLAAAGYPGTDLVLGPANINTLHRVQTLEFQPSKASPNQTRVIVVGRRQRIAQGQAANTTPGEEPVDLAISVPPSLEVIGPNPSGTIALAVRISGAVRVKDPNGLVALIGP